MILCSPRAEQQSERTQSCITAQKAKAVTMVKHAVINKSASRDDTTSILLPAWHSKPLIRSSWLCHLSWSFAAQPDWLDVITDTEADIGSDLRWSCVASGKPRPAVRWLRDGQPLASQVPLTASLQIHLSPRLSPAFPFHVPP